MKNKIKLLESFSYYYVKYLLVCLLYFLLPACQQITIPTPLPEVIKPMSLEAGYGNIILNINLKHFAKEMPKLTVPKQELGNENLQVLKFLNVKLATTAINNSQINKLDIVITGINITTPITLTNVSAVNGEVTTANIAVPAGKKRIVSVTGKNGTTVIGGAELKGVFSVTNGETKTVTVSWQTTPTAKVIDRLINDGNGTNDDRNWESYANDLNADVLQTLIDNISSSTHRSLIDAQALAEYIKANNGNLPASAVGYISAGATVAGTVSSLITGDAVSISINDPSSQSLNFSSSTSGYPNYSIGYITPTNLLSGNPSWSFTVNWSNKPTSGWSSTNYTITGGDSLGTISSGTNISRNISLSWPTPTLTSVSQSIGIPGETVILNGSNFHPNVLNNTVIFNDILGISPLSPISSSTQLNVTVPYNALSGPIKVSVSGKQSGTVNLKTLQTVSSYAGNGNSGYWNSSNKLSAQFNMPRGTRFDTNGNVFIADSVNAVIRKIDTSGSVSTYLGTPITPGHVDSYAWPTPTPPMPPATQAKFDAPTDMVIDSSNNMFVSDQGTATANPSIRRITSTGHVLTLALDPAVLPINQPIGLALDSGGSTLYIANSGTNKIYKVTSFSYNVTTPTYSTAVLIAGDGTAGYKDGIGDVAQFSGIKDIALNTTGTILYVAGFTNNTIRGIAIGATAATSTVFTVAGASDNSGGLNGPGLVNGKGMNAKLNGPYGLTIGPNDGIYVADYNNNVIRKIVKTGSYTPDYPGNYTVYTVAGDGVASDDDGIATLASFNKPVFLTFDTLLNLYVSEEANHKIKKLE